MEYVDELLAKLTLATATCVIGLPLRYMHTPVEVVCLIRLTSLDI